MMFRPFSAEALGNPLLEPFDVVRFPDRKGNEFVSLLNSVTYTVGSYTQIACEAEDPVRNGSVYHSDAAAAVVEARRETDKQITEYDKVVQSMNELAMNAMGYHTTYENKPDGSRITYLHDKPNLADSKTIYKQTIDGFFISTDGGKSYTSGFDSNGNVVLNILYAIGIVADWIRTGRFTVKKGSTTTFLADADTGEVRIVADSFSLTSGKTIEDIADEQVNDFISAVYDPQIANLQSQIDGQIETWYYDHEPTLYNTPASSWNTEALRARHEGDLFYWKSKGYSYRFFKDGGTWKWQLITDSDITKALANAAKAQDTADHKRRVFISTPYTPYDAGGLWFGGNGSDIMTCVTSRASGSYVSSDWQKMNKYIDQATASTVANNAAETSWKNKTNVDIFNKLTKNGTVQGISTDPDTGDIYINATYINSGAMSADHIRGGTLALGGVNNVNGAMNIYNSSGTRVGYWNNTGINAIAGTIGGFTISSTKIYGTSSTGKVIAIQKGSQNVHTAFAAGGSSHSDYSDCPFRVSMDGKLYATDATISGNITASTLSITGDIYAGGQKIDGQDTTIHIIDGKYIHHYYFRKGLLKGHSMETNPNA